MLELLKNYSLQNIAIFIVILSFAVKGVVDFYDWAKARINKPIDEKNVKKEQEQKMIEQLEYHEKEIERLKDNQKEILRIVNILIDSDKDDIKAWITEKHHYFCYELGYIDDYNLQCIEARYKHYKDENGNTFIDSFMEDIKGLPVVSVTKQKEKDQ